VATVYHYLVAWAMLANAIVGHLLYRSAFAGAGHEPVLAEGVAVGDTAPAIARGAFRFWLLVLGVSFLAHLIERLQP
jgi:hypothetical protein